MTLAVSSDKARPLSEHLAELNHVIRISAILLFFATIACAYATDSLMRAWLNYLPLGADAPNLSVYSPFEWLEIRWSLAILLALLTVMPAISLQLHRFARPGLLPRERSWLATLLCLSIAIIPLVILATWGYMLPFFIEAAHAADSLEGVGTRYDASALFRLALGFSWLFVTIMLATLSLSIARLIGLVEHGEVRFRARILLIFGGLLLLTLPTEYEGLRLLAAFAAMALADTISRTLPEAPLGRRKFKVDDVLSRGGSTHRVALLDCGCEGACPRFPTGSVHHGVAMPKCSALCLEPTEQDALADMVLHHGITNLIITGCDATPLPLSLRSSLDSMGCGYAGLGWLDAPESSDDSWKASSISDLMHHLTESALD